MLSIKVCVPLAMKEFCAASAAKDMRTLKALDVQYAGRGSASFSWFLRFFYEYCFITTQFIKQ